MRRGAVAVPWLAAAALLGGLLWIVKGAAILLGYGQPEHAFEVAPLLFALVTLGLARWLPPDRARRFGVVLAVAAVLGALSAIDERLLEVPIVALGLGWVAVGLALVRQMRAAPHTPSRPSL